MPSSGQQEPDVQVQGKVLNWLLKEWASRFGLALESMTGGTAAIETGEARAAAFPNAAEGESGQFWWRQPFQPIPDAVVWVGAQEVTWTAIGQSILKAAGVEDATSDDLRGTYLEVIRQALGGVAQALAGLIHADVLCDGGEEKTEGPGFDVFPVRVSLEGAPALELALAFSAGLTRPPQSSAQASQPGREVQQAAASHAEEPDTNRTLDLLYDVELPVSVSFGRAHLPLREVLKLTSGSIVELNRTISEPVEVIVNNCVIARGEVVVVDGNYGVRINQIVSRRERLRTLY